MEGFLSIIQSFSLLIVVVLSVGIMFGVLRARTIIYLIIFIALLPLLFGSIINAFKVGFSGEIPWQMLVIGFFVCIIAIRMFMNMVFRRK